MFFKQSLVAQNYDKHPIFILKDVTFQELEAMMEYMYKGEVNIAQDQLKGLLKTAESLLIKGLYDNKMQTKGTTSDESSVSVAMPMVERCETNNDGICSQSPVPRKRKRVRHKSADDLDCFSESSSNVISAETNKAANSVPEQLLEIKSEILTKQAGKSIIIMPKNIVL